MKIRTNAQSEKKQGNQSLRIKAGRARHAALLGLFSVLAVTALASAMDVRGKKAVKFYQRNAYIGGFIEAPLALDPTDPNYGSNLLVTVTGVYMQIVASDPPTRMAGLAEELATQQPDIAALEEIYTIEQAPATLQGPGEFTVVYDYLQLLTNALAAKGMHYQVAVVSTEMDVAMPMIASLEPFEMAYARAIDHEVILVRTDLPPGYLQVSNPKTGRFTTYLQVPVGPETISVIRGWCSVDVFTRGERFNCICAHLEDESMPEIQEAQGQELLAGPANVSTPVVILGDFNADPLDRTGTTTYHPFIQAGFKDAWAALNSHDPAGGLTWGHDPNLVDPTTDFVYRIDFVLYRGNQFTPTAAAVLDPQINVSAPPFWPSDHAALTATFSLGNPKAAKQKVNF